MRKIVCIMSIGAFWLAAAVGPGSAADSAAHKLASAGSAAVTMIPEAKSPVTRPYTRTTQLVGNICRNGGYYCVMVGAGYVGAPCCGCGFCGLWSNF